MVLAHAVLHCTSGPWLSESWNKEHISFFRYDPAARPDVRHPFLKLQFAGAAADPVDSSLCLHPNPRLLALGILLLEIHLEEPIESNWTDEDKTDGIPNENTNLTTALRLLEDLDGTVYEGYRAAIEACLKCDKEEYETLESRREIFEKIVSPLEAELEHGFHITPEKLHLTW